MAARNKRVANDKKVVGVWNRNAGIRKAEFTPWIPTRVRQPVQVLVAALPSAPHIFGIITTLVLALGGLGLAAMVLLVSREGPPSKVADAAAREVSISATRVKTISLEKEQRPLAARTTTDRRFRAGSKKFAVLGLANARLSTYRRLLLLDIQTNRMHSVRIGEEITKGFRITEMTPISVTITSRDEATTIQF